MNSRDIKRWIERRAGLIFGVHRQAAMPRGTSLGSPIFYLRLGNGRDGLVRFEVGTARRFVYVTPDVTTPAPAARVCPDDPADVPGEVSE